MNDLKILTVYNDNCLHLLMWPELVCKGLMLVENFSFNLRVLIKNLFIFPRNALSSE